jgi:hypothetical protein
VLKQIAGHASIRRKHRRDDSAGIVTKVAAHCPIDNVATTFNVAVDCKAAASQLTLLAGTRPHM